MATTACTACGARSSTSDYCDTCGAALAPGQADPAPARAAASPASPATAAASGAVGRCPHCDALRTADDSFCEVCGLDFATGQLPAAPAPRAAAADAPSGWTAVIEADRAFFDGNVVDGTAPVAFPSAAVAREVTLSGDEVVVGRRSEAKGFFPAIDLSTPVADPAVSHHHAVLRRQPDSSWVLVDEGSTNSTWLNGAATPLEHGVVAAIHDGDHINVGSFTRITFRKAP